MSTKSSPFVNIDINTICWLVIQYALKALAVLLLWNHIVAPQMQLPEVTFGVVFALAVAVKVLFSNLNGFSPHQTRHLYDLKNLVQHLVSNQFALAQMLQQYIGSIDPNQKPENQVDESNKAGYNTNESENEVE